MAMIEVTRTHDYSGREYIIYCDTDDLSQEDYSEFLRLQKAGKKKEALQLISKNVCQQS